MHSKAALGILAAVLVVGTSVALAYSYPLLSGGVTVTEPITLTPGSMSINGYPDQVLTLHVTVTNIGPTTVSFVLRGNVTRWPTGGSAKDLTFSFPYQFSATPGTAVLNYTVAIGNGAAAGLYSFTINFTRKN